MSTPENIFGSDHYVRHNMRRLEHLTSLELPLSNRTVLELGAGIGDHTMFYLDRGCSVTALEGREDNVRAAKARMDEAKSRYEGQKIDYHTFDLESPEEAEKTTPIADAEIIHCYGLLYHLRQPLPMLKWARRKCLDIMIVETALSAGDEEALENVNEDASKVSQALIGVGSRPTRSWVFNSLSRLFPYVYAPATQPSHEEFPTDWRKSQLEGRALIRGVFVASLRPLGNSLLLDRLPQTQRRV